MLTPRSVSQRKLIWGVALNSLETARVCFCYNLLLEFGAVLQLAQWEQDGFTAHIDAGLPSYADAFAELVAKTEQGLWDNEVIPSDTLAFKVFRLSLDEFSWDAPSLLGIDVQLKADDEDEFVERLAEFLWENCRRHQTSQQEERDADGS